nr:MAG TPA: hypothetical protein [Caudoviricetes sp.]
MRGHILLIIPLPLFLALDVMLLRFFTLQRATAC